ncbi:MAG: tetratricopeptide repeat protein [Acidobacteriota bacterium]
MRGERRAPVLAAVGLLLLFAGCQATVDRFRANYAAKQGNDFYKAGDYDKAIEWYRYATYLNPELGIAYYHAALANMALYKPGSRHWKDLHYSQEAIDNLKRYLYFTPGNQEAKDHLLTVYLQAERYDEAADFFKDELEAVGGEDPARASELMQRLGMIYAKKGDFDNSFEWYKKRAEIERDSPEAFYTIGVLCWDKVYHAGLMLDLDRRKELIEMGLDYLRQATDLRENYFEAVSYINLLFREKAKIAAQLGNNEDYAKWTQEADKNLKLALRMRKEVMAKK